MPFIHIKSLPLNKSINVKNVVEDIAKEFANEVGIGLEHVTSTWEYFQPGHYAVAGKASGNQSNDTHPVIIDLLAPDFNSSEDVEKMLTVIAKSVSRYTGISESNIFINYRGAHSGEVFDSGEIVRW